MKNKKKILLRTGILVTMVSLSPFLAMAQIDPGGCPTCPIDGGLSLLLAAGVGYGVKKYRDSKKVEDNPVS